MCFLSSPLPPLCCRFIPGPNRELRSQGCVPGSSPHLPFSLPIEWSKTITSTATDWITWNHRKDIHPDKTALLAWCQGFETALIPCLIKEPHVGDSPLPRSCGQFLICSLSPSSCLSHKNWNSLAGVILRWLKHYVKTFALACQKKVNQPGSLHGPGIGILRTKGTREGNYPDVLLSSVWKKPLCLTR